MSAGEVIALAAYVGIATLFPAIALFVAAQRLARRADTQRIDGAERGQSGLLVGRVVSDAGVVAALSNAPAVLVRYNVDRRRFRTYGAHRVVIETGRGLRIGIDYTERAFVTLGEHHLREATFHDASRAPGDLKDAMRTSYSGYVTEHRISPGDMLGAVGTLAAPTTPDVAFDLVGTRRLPLQVGDATLDFWLQPSTQTAWRMMGVVLVVCWVVVTAAVAMRPPG